jgi:hypothetical protein
MHSKLTCTQYYLKQNSRSKDMRFLVKYHMQKKLRIVYMTGAGPNLIA